MSEPRFPPPGYEGSYRDAALPAADTPAEPPETPGSVHPRVVVKRAEDPDVVHLEPAAMDHQDAMVAGRLQAQRRLAIVVVIFVVVMLALRVAAFVLK